MTRLRNIQAAGRGEDGFAVVIVMLILVIGLGLGAAALASTLNSRSAANRQSRLQRAQAAADAGIQAQLYVQASSPNAVLTTYNLNGGPLGLSTFLDCAVAEITGSGAGTVLTGTVAALSVNAGSVCPPSASPGGAGQSTVVTQSDGDHGFHQAEFIPDPQMPFGGGETVLYPKIVSLGWDDRGNASNTDNHVVYARKEAILAPIAPLQTVEAQGNLTYSAISLTGVNAAGVVNGNMQAAGSVTIPAAFAMANLTSTSILGTITYGSGSAPAPTLGNVVHATPPQRAPITVAASKPSCPDAGNACTGITGPGYNPATNEFNLSAGQSATFSTGDYVLCNFKAASGASVIAPSITSTGVVRIFIDSPTSKRCGSALTNAGLNQYNDTANASRGNFLAPSGVTNGLLTGLTASSDLQIYVVGDQNATNPYDNATTVNIGATGTCVIGLSPLGVPICVGINPVLLGMIIYAPTSTVTVNTGACVTLVVSLACTGGLFEGAIVGDNVNVSAATMTQDLQLTAFPLYNGVNADNVIAYKQCTAVTSLAGLSSPGSATAAQTDLSGC